MAGSDSASIHLIKKAIEFDTNKRYADALVCYREGVELLLQEFKMIQDEKKKLAFRQKISSYIERAEKLKQLVNEIKESGKYHEQINIDENSTGNSYEKLFTRFFLDEILDYIEIDDPYIISRHQTHNFLRFCEMIVKLTKSVKEIILITTEDQEPNSYSQQKSRLDEIKESLQRRNVKLVVKFNNSLHDREIRLSTGWIIKIGRGLDYFKAPESKEKLCIGFHDLDLRPCHATSIDIFHKNSTKITK